MAGKFVLSLAKNGTAKIEIISDSETTRSIGDKLADYISIGVQEAWLIRPGTRLVELVRLTASGPETVGVYDTTQTFASLSFPDLTVATADLLHE